MQELKIIDQRDVLGKDFKIYGEFDNPLFLAKDIAEWIEHSNPTVMLMQIDNVEKVLNNVYTLGGVQESWFVTEDGLMEILFQSRKPIAKEFKKQVKEILRTIRKYGMYATDQLLDNPDFAIEIFQKLKVEREEKKTLQLQNAQQSQIINELQPKATYYDLVLQNKTLLSMTKIAKDYGMSAIALNEMLHDLGVQFKQSGVWLLYQKYADKGYTQSKTHVLDDARNKFHTYWTQKGRLFIYELLKQQKQLFPLIERE